MHPARLTPPRPLQAMCLRFFEHCKQHGIPLDGAAPFTLSYTTNIPRQVRPAAPCCAQLPRLLPLRRPTACHAPPLLTPCIVALLVACSAASVAPRRWPAPRSAACLCTTAWKLQCPCPFGPNWYWRRSSCWASRLGCRIEWFRWAVRLGPRHYPGGATRPVVPDPPQAPCSCTAAAHLAGTALALLLVPQVYGGLLFMDFSPALPGQASAPGRYQALDPGQLPPLHLIFDASPPAAGKDSGAVHSDVRQRWLAGDEQARCGATPAWLRAADRQAAAGRQFCLPTRCASSPFRQPLPRGHPCHRLRP